MKEIVKKLNKPFPKEAESTDPARGFTGIKTPYVIERLNEVFGLCGQGWTFEITHLDVQENLVIATVQLQYVIGEEWSKPIVASGDMAVIRERVGDSIKGAVSDAIKKAASYLGVGLDAYKGLLNGSQKQPTKRRAPPRATLQDKQEAIKHWIDEPKVRNRFWAFAKADLGLTEDQVHKALTPTSKAEPIGSVREFKGTMEEARELLESYLSEVPVKLPSWEGMEVAGEEGAG